MKNKLVINTIRDRIKNNSPRDLTKVGPEELLEHFLETETQKPPQPLKSLCAGPSNSLALLVNSLRVGNRLPAWRHAHAAA